MLDDITELRTFVRIAAAGSLSAASREMGLALSVVSKRLATLERRTEVRLIARNTRSLALTEEGQHLFERAQRILAEVDEAEAALTKAASNRKAFCGWALRMRWVAPMSVLSAGTSFGRIPRFRSSSF